MDCKFDPPKSESAGKYELRVAKPVLRGHLQVAYPTTDLVVICEDHDNELVLRFHEPETQGQTRAAFEDVAFQLSNAEPAVDVRIAEGFAEIKQREHGRDSFRLGAGAQLLLHGRG